MGIGVLLLAGIVLCISLLARLIISQFFTQQVFDNNSSMPLVPGINESLFEQKENAAPASKDRSDENTTPAKGSKDGET